MTAVSPSTTSLTLSLCLQNNQQSTTRIVHINLHTPEQNLSCRVGISIIPAIMRFSTTILAISAMGAVNAGVLPRSTKTYSLASDSPNGFYLHTIGPNGNPQNAHIGDLNTFLPDLNSTSDASNPHQRRQDGQGDVNCKNQYVLNYNDIVSAEQGLEAMYQYGGTFNDQTTSYKYGSAVAYGCNYGGGQTISGSWLAAQFSRISQQCGTSGSGWVTYPDWKASYGIDSSAVGFC